MPRLPHGGRRNVERRRVEAERGDVFGVVTEPAPDDQRMLAVAGHPVGMSPVDEEPLR